jgi:hypothetical protein
MFVDIKKVKSVQPAGSPCGEKLASCNSKDKGAHRLAAHWK